MGSPPYLRALGALIVAGILTSLFLMLGAPLAAALLAAALGAGYAFVLGHDPAVPPPALDPIDPFTAARPIIERLIESSEDPLLLVDRQSVIFANRPAIALLGGHIIGDDVRLAIRHPAAARRLLGQDAPDGSADYLPSPVQLVGLGDAERRWELSVHPLSPTRRLVRLTDRTSSYAAERMRVDFVANASHELRTPLATLIGFLETLEDEKAVNDPATRGRFINIMAGEARRMQRLVSDLISLSRIEAEKFSQPDTTVALAPLVSEVTDAIIASAKEGERERIQLSPVEAALAVTGDLPQLSQLLHNLIGNALKYGRPGSPVRISAALDSDDMIRLVVADEGEGIAPEHLPRLTERFYRIDPGRSRAGGGTGLGLAIVKHIVERHRGRLDIASTAGIGTTVTVLLPATAPERLS